MTLHKHKVCPTILYVEAIFSILSFTSKTMMTYVFTLSLSSHLACMSLEQVKIAFSFLYTGLLEHVTWLHV